MSRAKFASKAPSPSPPFHFQTLPKPEQGHRLVLQNPSSRSPGLAAPSKTTSNRVRSSHRLPHRFAALRVRAFLRQAIRLRNSFGAFILPLRGIPIAGLFTSSKKETAYATESRSLWLVRIKEINFAAQRRFG